MSEENDDKLKDVQANPDISTQGYKRRVQPESVFKQEASFSEMHLTTCCRSDKMVSFSPDLLTLGMTKNALIPLDDSLPSL